MVIKKVLLTGATGLIGQYACEPLLRDGYEVVALCRRRPPDNGIAWRECDLFDLKEVNTRLAEESATHLLHLAWDVRPEAYREDNSNFGWLAASLELLQAFRRNGGRRAVFAGTVLEYETESMPLVEGVSSIGPKCAYEFCKAHLNELASLFCRNNAVSFGWARIFFTYGANEAPRRLAGAIVESLSRGDNVVIRGGPLLRDYLYAKDIAAGLARFLDSSVQGEVNVCSGKAVSIREFSIALAEMIGRRELLSFRDDVPGQPACIVGDNRRLCEEVGFTPEYDLNAGFRDMLAKTDS
jgi:Nucleoside-diphosphate-sugar epimerases